MELISKYACVTITGAEALSWHFFKAALISLAINSKKGS